MDMNVGGSLFSVSLIVGGLMKYQIGDLLADEDGNSGIVVIKWDDGDICDIENDAAHPNPILAGHWPPNNPPQPTTKGGDPSLR